MRMPSFFHYRRPALLAGMLYVFFAAGLTGCASKNPLMGEPVASGTVAATPATTPVGATEKNAVAAPATAGVQTIKERRFLGLLSPYRIDIQQGNFVSEEMVSQLKEGMTPDQVRFVLGAPLLTDIFHANRWDYPFRLQKGNGEVTTSRVTVFFKDNRLARFEGGELPTEKDYLARLAGAAAAAR
jgi:outer membrane protein assembly factor BamE